jgi:hypothetical protein
MALSNRIVSVLNCPYRLIFMYSVAVFRETLKSHMSNSKDNVLDVSYALVDSHGNLISGPSFSECTCD